MRLVSAGGGVGHARFCMRTLSASQRTLSTKKKGWLLRRRRSGESRSLNRLSGRKLLGKLNAFRLGLFALRHGNRKNAVAIVSPDFRSVHRERQRYRALEFSIEPFGPIKLAFL